MSNEVTHMPGQFAGADRGVGQSFTTRVSDFVRSLKDRAARALEIRRTYDMLDDLDDRMLADIGISRCEIPAVAIHSADHPDIPYHEYHRKQVR